MSKETYDIFGEDEKYLALTFDKVQKAVDLYVGSIRNIQCCLMIH
jgi:hypothetical protein